jgi:hypothetical protein
MRLSTPVRGIPEKPAYGLRTVFKSAPISPNPVLAKENPVESTVGFGVAINYLIVLVVQHHPIQDALQQAYLVTDT